MTEVTAEMIERGRGGDPEVAARRRQLASSIRETRQKLTSSGFGRGTFARELIRSFAQSRKSGAPAVAALALTIGMVATIWIPVVQAVIWLSLVMTAIAVGYSMAVKYLATEGPDTDIPAWQMRFVIAEAIQGVAWAALVVFMFGMTDDSIRSFLLVALLLVAAMSALLSAGIPEAVYASVGPITGAIVIFMQWPLNLQTLPLTLLAVAAQIYFVVLARRLHSTTVSSLSFSMDKEALIAELEEAKSNSDQARRRAEEASLAKSRFLATMSHELRTPLNAILGFSEVMKSELFGPHTVPSYREYSNDIHSSGQHLLMLINEILDLSRVEAGRYELKEESVSLANVVEDCQHLLAMRAKKRDVTVMDFVEPNLPRVWADERAMRQITLNLLTNAIKFTPQGGSVRIKVGWTSSGGQYLSIKDTGPGIPPEEIPIVLSSFGRGSMAQKNADEGSGLGLPIVKGLVELHGGTFTLKSEVREGTEVIVILPPERIIDALPQLDPDAPDASLPPAKRRRKAA
jgi:two-component system cell cycle sensor histidine kinase PleC